MLWALMFVNGLCLMIGYRTRVAQLLALLFQTGMNSRVLMIENGGYVVNNLLLLWTAFLPLGDRFSVDALRASLKRRRERSPPSSTTATRSCRRRSPRRSCPSSAWP